MHSAQFLAGVAMSGQASIQPSAEFSLPFGIVLPIAPAEIFGQFEPFLGG